MKKRVAKKIQKNKKTLQYSPAQLAASEVVLAEVSAETEKKKEPSAPEAPPAEDAPGE